MRQARPTRRRLPLRLGLGVVAAAVLALGGAAPAQADQAADKIIKVSDAVQVEGLYIVVLHGEPSLAAGTEARVRDTAQTMLERYGGSLEHTYSAALRGFSVHMSAEQARAMAVDQRVDYIQESSLVRAAGTQENPPSWGLDRVGQHDLPLNDKYAYPSTGEGVTAYVLDSGIRKTHETFEGRASYGPDFVDEDDTSQDCHGHGTHTAGTVGGETFGVAKEVTLVAVRVLGCDGTAPDADSIEGIDWVTQNGTRPAVVNMSLTSGGADDQPKAMVEAVERSIEAGFNYSLAAGNSASDACNTSPAKAPHAITVGATRRSDGRSGFSNYGSCLDLFAPGSNITSASHTSDTGGTTMSGTSMAAPHVAGAAALYLSAHPEAQPKEVRDAVVTAASKGKVGNPGSGSPNLLLYVKELGGG